MSKLCVVVCALTLLVTYVQAFRSGIVKIYGSQPSRFAGQCSNEGEDCLSDSRCCLGMICSYSFGGRSLSGKCRRTYYGADGRTCETHEECGRNFCCQRETVGYRGPTRHICRFDPDPCSPSDLPAPPPVDPGYFRYYKWRTMRRRGRKRTVA